MTCESVHPETGEPCFWPPDHPQVLVDPIATRDGRGRLVDHSWALSGIPWQIASPGRGDLTWAEPSQSIGARYEY